MTRERLAELWPVMEAFRDGKTVQARRTGGPWVDERDPHWVDDCEYRIKPSPREWFIPEFVTGVGRAYSSYHSAQRDNPSAIRIIHVREVLP